MSHHATREEAEQHVRDRLHELDPSQTTSWAAVMRIAVRYDPRLTASHAYEAAEGDKLEAIVQRVRDSRLL